LVVTGIGLIVLTKPRATWFWYGLFVGTVGAAGLAVYQFFVVDMMRAEGFHMPIMFGDIAIAMGLLALASSDYFAKTRLAPMPYVAFFAGICASLLSGSRGGWVALFLAFIPLYSYGQRATRRRIVAMVALSLLLFIGACLTQLSIRQRFTDIWTDIHQYQLGQIGTSVGTRFEMWKAAGKMFLEHPIIGVGRANYHEALSPLIARGEVDPVIRDFYHAHNEFLHALATQGLLGGLTLLFLYAAPLVFFIRCFRKRDVAQPYALAGVLLVLSFIDFGLTQVMFAHHVGCAFYAATVSVLAGLCVMLPRA